MLRNPEEFKSSLPAGYDGLFDWDFIVAAGAFPRGIEPMDIDASVEVGGRLLCWETKAPGTKMKRGQRMAIIRHVKLGRGRVSYLFHEKVQDDITDPLYLSAYDWDHQVDVAKVPVGLHQCRGGNWRDVVNLCRLWADKADKGEALNAPDFAQLNYDFLKTVHN